MDSLAQGWILEYLIIPHLYFPLRQRTYFCLLWLGVPSRSLTFGQTSYLYQIPTWKESWEPISSDRLCFACHTSTRWFSLWYLVAHSCQIRIRLRRTIAFWVTLHITLTLQPSKDHYNRNLLKGKKLWVGRASCKAWWPLCLIQFRWMKNLHFLFLLQGYPRAVKYHQLWVFILRSHPKQRITTRQWFRFRHSWSKNTFQSF